MAPDAADAARDACHEVVVAYLSAVDHHRGTSALQYFSEDAEIVAGGRLLTGSAEIGAFLAEREADTGRHTAHLVTNEVFRQVDADEAELEARVVLLLWQEGGGYRVGQIVETTQRLRRDGSRWRIVHRTATPLHDHP